MVNLIIECVKALRKDIEALEKIPFDSKGSPVEVHHSIRLFDERDALRVLLKVLRDKGVFL